MNASCSEFNSSLHTLPLSLSLSLSLIFHLSLSESVTCVEFNGSLIRAERREDERQGAVHESLGFIRISGNWY